MLVRTDIIMNKENLYWTVHTKDSSYIQKPPMKWILHYCNICIMLKCLSFVFLSILFSSCATLPKDIHRVPSYAIEPSEDTKLVKAVGRDSIKHPGDSGFYMLPSDMDAFIARALLIDGADKTLDLQYYIVSNDLSVGFLIEKLISAADRGVRVRLLFDYVGTGLSESQMWMLDSHPNIELRLFNPKGSLRQLNHRMHNKAFVADNIIGIVGGRNLADEYFGASKDSNFADMDLIAAGPVVKDISKSFDIYWNCEWAIPYEYLSSNRPGAEELEESLESLKETNRTAMNSEYAIRLKQSDFLNRIVSGRFTYSWAKGNVIYDLPEKIAGKGDMDSDSNLMTRLLPLIRDTKSELILVSPYFVPDKTVIDIIGMLHSTGIKVRITTNSLASTDVISVYSGYARYRKTLLQKGVELYEMRADPEEKGKESRSEIMGSYRVSLHAKFYVFDRKEAFIGSRNLDARSRELNTEIGIFVQSPEIAEQAAKMFEVSMLPQYTFKLELSDKSRLIWKTEENGKEVTYTHSPMTSLWRRFSAGVISIFAPESQL
jgi:putative cardiolipin synthase